MSETALTTATPPQTDGRTQAFARLLAGRQDPERTVAIMATVAKSPALRSCSRDSISQAVYEAVAYGLDPTPALGQVYLVPFRSEATVILGYRGIITLAARHGVSITCDVVRQGDVLEYEDRPDGLHFRHAPADPFASGDGEIIGAYAAFRIGGRIVHVERTPVEAGKALAAKARGGSPWKEHFAAMLRKTPIRRGFSRLPLETEALAQLAALVHQDAEREGEVMGTGPTVVQVQAGAELDAFASRAIGAAEPEAEAPREREPGDDDDWIDGGGQ